MLSSTTNQQASVTPDKISDLRSGRLVGDIGQNLAVTPMTPWNPGGLIAKALLHQLSYRRMYDDFAGIKTKET